jgi:adenine deaminase
MRMSSDATSSVEATIMEETSTILAGQLFDSYTGQLVRNQLITVNQASGLILDVSTFKEEDAPRLLQESSTVHDLRHLTVLPGFVDVHVHCEFLADL